VDESVACRSGVIRTVLEDVGSKDPIPLLNVKANALVKVLEYCEHHRDDPIPPLDSEWGTSFTLDLMRRKNTQIGDWDQQYIKCDQELLFQVIQAASYLDIKSLLDLGCKSVANMMTGKSAVDIRELFHIENDFTPEEELAMQVERSEMENLYNMLGFSLDQPPDDHNSKTRRKGLRCRPPNPKAPAPPGKPQLDRVHLQSIVDEQLAVASVMRRNGDFDPSTPLRKTAKRRISELRQGQTEVRRQRFH